MKGFCAALLLLAALATGCAAASGPTTDRATPSSGVAAARSFTLPFPPDFAVTENPDELARSGYFPLPVRAMKLGGRYSGSAYAGTNFGSAGIVVGVEPEGARQAACADFEESMCGAEGGVRDVVVAAIPFRTATMFDAAMSHRLEIREYWTVHEGRRYALFLYVSHTDPGVYPPGSIAVFDEKDCWARLLDVLNGFAFTAPSVGAGGD